MTLTTSSTKNMLAFSERVWELFTDSPNQSSESKSTDSANIEDKPVTDAPDAQVSTGWGLFGQKRVGEQTGPLDAEKRQKAEILESSVCEEARLVDDAKQDPDQFGVLYNRYADKVYAYVYNRVGNAQDSEDLTARTFYKAFLRLDTYEDRGFPFSAWLFRIAHNLVANWHRDHSKRRFLSLDRLWSHSRDDELPELKLEQAEKHGELWDAINRLPEDRRSLLIYKFSSRLSNVEIGRLMNKSESAIKSLYFRTLATLRNDLEARQWEK